jgi:hypothetical protein
LSVHWCCCSPQLSWHHCQILEGSLAPGKDIMKSATPLQKHLLVKEFNLLWYCHLICSIWQQMVLNSDPKSSNG